MNQFIAWLSKRKSDAEDIVKMHDALWRQRIKAHLDAVRVLTISPGPFRDGWESAIEEIKVRLEIE